jgi:predicted dehydrogenase
MTPVRIAIVGCGLITEEMHLPALLASRELEVAALVDANLSRARLLMRKYGLTCTIAGDLSAALVDAVDGVVIATPNHTHAEIARVAVDRGCPVLIEKPITVSYADAAELCGRARRTGTFVSVGFVTRHFPVVPLFKQLMDAGHFGRIESFHFEYGTKGGWAPTSGYTQSRAQAGGGVLVTNGTHFLDRMLYWFGYPTSFQYADDTHGGLEANCKASVEFTGGVRGTLFFSKTISLKNTFVAKTDRATVTIPYSEVNQITLRRNDTPCVTFTAKGSSSTITGVDAFRLQLEEFGRIIRHGGTPTVTGEAGAQSVKLCEEFYAVRQPLDEPWEWFRRQDAV